MKKVRHKTKATLLGKQMIDWWLNCLVSCIMLLLMVFLVSQLIYIKDYVDCNFSSFFFQFQVFPAFFGPSVKGNLKKSSLKGIVG